MMISDIAHAPSTICDDTLLAYEPQPFVVNYGALGFRVSLRSNNPQLLEIARASWQADACGEAGAHIHLQIGVRESESSACPQAPVLRAQRHLITTICDPENFITCDIHAGYAFGWITSAVLGYPEFLRYHLLDASILTLLTCRYLTPVHAACVSHRGRGILLHGPSGAGKSTLAYACARAGWTYTTDDAAYMLRSSSEVLVRGRCTQFRFRPSARELFPELRRHGITPRAEGKPSIEIPSQDCPGISTAPEHSVHALVELNRISRPSTFLTPLSVSKALSSWEGSLFPLESVRDKQIPTLQRLATLKLFTLHYRDLEPAIEVLRALAEGRVE